MAGSGELLEWAGEFSDIARGLPRGRSATMAEGGDVPLELDVQGARQVREVVPEAVPLVLLEPPSIEEPERRLRARGTETEDVLARRLSKAEWELGERELFDQVVVNDVAERGCGEASPSSVRLPGIPRKEGRPMIEPKIDELLAGRLEIHAGHPGRQARPGDQLLLQPARRGPRGVRPAARRVGACNKPLSIALEEISEGKINAERPEGVGIK